MVSFNRRSLHKTYHTFFTRISLSFILNSFQFYSNLLYWPIMSVKEIQIPLDPKESSVGKITAHYCYQIKTVEDYLGIFDLSCPYIIVGIGQPETSSPRSFFANCRFHQDLGYIIKQELGESAKLTAYGQFYHHPGSSGYRQFHTLGLISPSVLPTPDETVEQNLQFLLENINPSFLKSSVDLTWTENKTKRSWIYWKQERKLANISSFLL